MLNFVLIHRTVIAYNFLQQQAKLWNIPLAVAQLIKILSLGVVGIRPELHVERPARGDDPQFFVKNDQKFSNGVYHRLRERTGVFDFAELLFKHG